MFNKKIMSLFLLFFSFHILGMQQSLGKQKGQISRILFAPFADTQSNTIFPRSSGLQYSWNNGFCKVAVAQKVLEAPRALEDAISIHRNVPLTIFRVHNKIEKCLYKDLGTVHFPTKMYHLRLELVKAHENVIQRSQKYPTDYMHVSRGEQYRILQSFKNNVKSLTEEMAQKDYPKLYAEKVQACRSAWRSSTKEIKCKECITCMDDWAKKQAELNKTKEQMDRVQKLFDAAEKSRKDKITQKYDRQLQEIEQKIQALKELKQLRDETEHKNNTHTVIQQLYETVVQKNAQTESVTRLENLRERILHGKVDIAKNICEQNFTERYKDRTYDISHIDPEFLKTHGFDVQELSELKHATELQDFQHKEFLCHVKQSEKFHKEQADVAHVSPYIAKYDECIQKGIAYNKAGDISKAVALSDLCWGIATHIKKTVDTFSNAGLVVISALDAGTDLAVKICVEALHVCEKWVGDVIDRPIVHGKAALEGIADGVVNSSKRIVKAAEKVVGAISEPRAACKKIYGKSCKLVTVVKDFTLECIDTCIVAIENPNQSQKEIQIWKEKAYQFLDDLGDHISHSDKTEITHAISKIGTETYVYAQVGNFVTKVTKIGCAKASEQIKKGYQKLRRAKVPTTVSTTPEGISVTIKGGNPLAMDAEKVVEGTRKIVVDAEVAEELTKASVKNLKNGFQLIGKGSTLRKVRFMRGFRHNLDKHFFNKTGKWAKSALKNLDPQGNPDKWMQHICRIAQTGKGVAKKVIKRMGNKTVVVGETMEIIGNMGKTGGGTLKIGVRMFRAEGSDIWRIVTILTEQR